MHSRLMIVCAVLALAGAAYAQTPGGTGGDVFNVNPGSASPAPDRSGSGPCQGDVFPGAILVTPEEMHRRNLKVCTLCRGDGAHVLCLPESPEPAPRPATREPLMPATDCAGLVAAARAAAASIEAGNTRPDAMANLTKVLQQCPPNFPRPIQCYAMMTDAQSKVRIDPDGSKQRARQAVACYEGRDAPGSRTARGAQERAGTDCMVYTLDGHPLAAGPRRSRNDPAPSKTPSGRNIRSEMPSRVILAAQDKFNLHCDELQDLSGDEPPPLDPYQLSVQLTDAECAWYFGIHEAIREEFTALLGDPSYRRPQDGAKVTARYLIVGPDNYDRGMLMWSGLAVAETGNQLPALGVVGDGALATFVRAAFTKVNERHQRSLALLPQWTKRLEPIRAADGRRVLRGVMLESDFMVDPLAINQHQYNVACLRWIRENADAKAVAYPNAKPWKFALR